MTCIFEAAYTPRSDLAARPRKRHTRHASTQLSRQSEILAPARNFRVHENESCRPGLIVVFAKGQRARIRRALEIDEIAVAASLKELRRCRELIALRHEEAATGHEGHRRSVR